MTGRLPLRLEFNRVFQKMMAEQSKHGPDGVNARVVGGLTGRFVELFEREQNAETYGPHFVSAVIAANANILAGLARYSFPPGQQRKALSTVLDMLRAQVTERLDPVDVATPVFFPSFDHQAGRRDTDAEHRIRRDAGPGENQ